ncbi:MAG: panF [Rickettsiaceae bacterium]|jgi:SSS family solute:Na+ symporter|nr:panF [Rickettsiaceae bacterium]
MSINFHSLSHDSTDSVIIIVYLIFTVILGLWAGFEIKSLRDYAIGERNLTAYIIINNVITFWVAGSLGLSPLINSFNHGIIALYPHIGIVISLLIYSKYISPLMKPFINAISVGEIMGIIYGKNARIITGIAATLRCFGSLSIRIYIIGNIFEYLLPASKLECMVLSAAVLSLYTTFGGMKSVIFANIFQLLITLVAICFITYFCYLKVEGFDGIISSLPSTHLALHHNNDVLINYTVLFLYFLVPFLNPIIVQQMLIAKNIKQMSTIFKTSAVLILIYLFSFVFLGLTGYSLSHEANPNFVLIRLVDNVLPAFFKGFVICGFLSIIISTADANLNIASVNLTNDVLKVIYPKVQEIDLLYYSRLISFVLGIISLCIAYIYDNLLEILIITQSVWLPVISIPLLFGMMKFRTPGLVFVLSASTGFVVYFTVRYLMPETMTNGIIALLMGALFNGIILVSVDNLIKKRDIIKHKTISIILNKVYNRS